MAILSCRQSQLDHRISSRLLYKTGLLLALLALSLHAEAGPSRQDSTLSVHHHQLVRKYLHSNLDSAAHHLREAGSVLGEGKSKNHFQQEYLTANLAFHQGFYDSSLSVLEKLQERLPKKAYEQRAEASLLKGLCFIRKGEHLGARDALYSALEQAEFAANNALQTEALVQLGNSQLILSQYREAIDEFKRALFRAQPDAVQSQASIHNLIAKAYTQIFEFDSIRDHAFTALSLARQIKDQEIQANALLHLSTYYREKNMLDSASACLESAMHLREEVPNPYYRCEDLFALAGIRWRQNRKQDAFALTHRALHLAKQHELPDLQQEAYYRLAKWFDIDHKFDSASFYFRMWGISKDSTFKYSSEKALAELRLRYDIARNEKRNLELENIRAEHEILLSERRSWIIGLIAALLILSSIAITITLRFRYRNQALRETNERNLQLARMRAILEGEAKERQRMAGELHDGLGQLLASVKLHLDSIEPNPDDLEMKERAISILKDTIDEVRTISHNLMPVALSRFGLEKALFDMKRTLEDTTDIQCQWEIQQELQLNELLEKSLFRVIQEIVNNIIKHSEASEVSLKIKQDELELTLHIKDNGKGFEVSRLEHSKGIGWDNIRLRVQTLGGQILLRSNEEHGSEYIISIPN